jgi:Fungal chitosanase of glycosyl hydrolase group 75
MSKTRVMTTGILMLAVSAPFGESLAQQSCNLSAAFSRPDERGTVSVRVFEGDASAQVSDAKPLFFKVPDLKVNTDGTRISYKADDPRGRHGAINDIRNAYNNPAKPVSAFEAIRDANWLPRSRVWQVLDDQIIEKDSRPGKEGLPCMDANGFLVSMTADTAVDGGFNHVGDCDQSKWIDASTVPALVLPGSSQFQQRGAKTRSVVVAMTVGAPHRVALGIVGDSGPSNEIGEASVEMNRILNGLPDGTLPSNREDAKERFQAPATIVMVLPGNSNRVPRPINPGSVKEFAKAKFEAWGGKEKLEACLSNMN